MDSGNQETLRLTGPFEQQVSRLVEDQPLTEKLFLLDTVRKFSAKLLSPVKRKLRELDRLGKAIPQIGRLWAEAQKEAGQKMPVTSIMRKAGKLGSLAVAAKNEVSQFNPLKKPVTEEEYEKPIEEELLTISSLIGLVLGIIGGLPLVMKLLAKLAKLLRMPRLQAAFLTAQEVTHHLEQRVVDVSIPDTLSYVLYKRVWKAGFKSSRDLLPFGIYRVSKAREKTESALYALLLVYFAYHGLGSCLHHGLSLFSSAEASATVVKGVEIGRGTLDITGILRGEL